MKEIYKMRSMWTLKEDMNEIKRKLELGKVFYGKRLSEIDKYREACKMILDIIKTEPQLSLSERSAAQIGYTNVIEDKAGNVDHYFISDDKLINFLTTTTIKDFRILRLKNLQQRIIVHTHKHAYAIFLGLDVKGEMVLNIYRDDDWINFDPEQKDHWKFVRKTGKGWLDTCRFIVNLLYYMNAFPEAIKAGLPDDMAKSYRQEAKSFACKKTIGVSDKIIATGETKMPHFRVGHFMTFYSDRYVNMKGKTIWVNDCVVNRSKAKTVDLIGG